MVSHTGTGVKGTLSCFLALFLQRCVRRADWASLVEHSVNMCEVCVKLQMQNSSGHWGAEGGAVQNWRVIETYLACALVCVRA